MDVGPWEGKLRSGTCICVQSLWTELGSRLKVDILVQAGNQVNSSTQDDVTLIVPSLIAGTMLGLHQLMSTGTL